MAGARPRPKAGRKALCSDGVERVVPDQMTLEEFESFPFREGDRWELIEGETVLSPSPDRKHQKLVFVLEQFLEGVLQGLRRPTLVYHEFDLRAPESSSYLCPDLIVATEAEFEAQKTHAFGGDPLLIVESLSPSTHGRDVAEKQAIYLRRGVAEYWVADPATGALFIYVRKKGEYEQQSADNDGYVPSPFCAQFLRIVPRGHSFQVLTKNLKKS